MRRTILPALILVTSGLGAQTLAVKGYPTQLVLDEISPGPAQLVTGAGAPLGLGVYVELWRVAAGENAAESIASVAASSDGTFAFADVTVLEGEHYYATLSRSWHFDRDGDFEGWDQMTSTDAELEVADGVLRITITDANRDGFHDPFLHNFFDYDPSLYRVVEVRLRNPANVTPARLGIFWGQPLEPTVFRHIASVPTAMVDFETLFIPMNVGEAVIPRVAGIDAEWNVDGLWTAAGVNDTLRLDPLCGLPRNTPGVEGVVFEIDSIRIREDIRVDFHIDDDLSGLGIFNGVNDVSIRRGFLGYTVIADPSVLFDVMTGRIETSHFTQFVVGLDGLSVANPATSLAVLFNDEDSGSSYLDDGGNMQSAELPLDLSTGVDAMMQLDLSTAPVGEWNEDGRVPMEGLQTSLPVGGTSGDVIGIDYFGWIPATPFGPSPAVLAAFPNNPPNVLITVDPSSAEVQIGDDDSARVELSSVGTDDGDGGAATLTFAWSKISGPDGDTIEAPTMPETGVVFSVAGDYVYRLTVDDGQLLDSSASADVTIVVLERPAPPESLFVRGDANSDGRGMEISDAMFVIRALFRPSSVGEPRCLDALDANDDGFIDLSDAVFMLRYRVSGRVVPPAPFPLCGSDPTDDALSTCDGADELCPTEEEAALVKRDRRRWKRTRRHRTRWR